MPNSRCNIDTCFLQLILHNVFRKKSYECLDQYCCLQPLLDCFSGINSKLVQY